MMDKIKKAVSSLNDLIKIQKGEVKTSPYMRGLCNGLICARSVLTGKDPKYFNAPLNGNQ